MFIVWNNNHLLVQELFIITLAQPKCSRSIIFPRGLCKSTAYIPLHFTLQQEDKEHLNRSYSAATVPTSNGAASADSASLFLPTKTNFKKKKKLGSPHIFIAVKYNAYWSDRLCYRVKMCVEEKLQIKKPQSTAPKYFLQCR